MENLRSLRIVIMCKMTPIGKRLNLKNFILIPGAVMELLRKVSQEGGIRRPPPPPSEIGLNCCISQGITGRDLKQSKRK